MPTVDYNTLETLTVPTATGTIEVPLALNPVPGADSAQQNQGASAAVRVDFLNRGLQSQYDSAVKDYNANLSSGTLKVAPPLPVAPHSWVFEPAVAGGAPGLTQTGALIVSSIPIQTLNLGGLQQLTPGNAPQGVFAGIGPQLWKSSYYSALYGDTWPDGELSPPQPPDGTQYTRKYAVVGWGYWVKG
jgi:hypothetical protein